MKAIYFDLDGTLCGLYNYPNWEILLNNEDTRPYEEATPLVDVRELRDILQAFTVLGITIGVISWSAMHGSKDYNRRTRKAKLDWCQKYFGDMFTEFHVVKYGTPKHYVRNIKESVLVDDNEDVRNAWKGETIDAKKDIVAILKNMLKELEG